MSITAVILGLDDEQCALKIPACFHASLQTAIILEAVPVYRCDKLNNPISGTATDIDALISKTNLIRFGLLSKNVSYRHQIQRAQYLLDLGTPYFRPGHTTSLVDGGLASKALGQTAVI